MQKQTESFPVSKTNLTTLIIDDILYLLSLLPCSVASPLGLDDWLEGRVTSSVMSSGTEEEEEEGPATTATHRR